MISASEKLEGHLAAATAVIIWGSTFVSTKVLLCDFSPVEILHLSNFLYIGVIACALSFLIWNYATVRIGAVSTNLYFYVQPAVTILFSMVILQEHMTWKGWLGTTLTFGGLILSQYSEKH